jgi:hypothetical protein
VHKVKDAGRMNRIRKNGRLSSDEIVLEQTGEGVAIRGAG